MKPSLISVCDSFVRVGVFLWLCGATAGLLTMDRKLTRLNAELVQARVVLVECRDRIDAFSIKPRDGVEAMRRFGMLEVTPTPDDVKPMPDGGPK